MQYITFNVVGTVLYFKSHTTFYKNIKVGVKLVI